MKRVMFILSGVVVTVLSYGFYHVDVKEHPVAAPERKNCTGYEVIEAGKGINCYGDTIKLTNKSGFYEVASNYSPQ